MTTKDYFEHLREENRRKKEITNQSRQMTEDGFDEWLDDGEEEG